MEKRPKRPKNTSFFGLKTRKLTEIEKKLVFLESTRQDGSNDTHIAWVDSKIKIQKFEILTKKGQRKGQNYKVQFWSHLYNMGIIGTVSTSRFQKYPIFSISVNFQGSRPKKAELFGLFGLFSKSAPWHFFNLAKCYQGVHGRTFQKKSSKL